MKREIIAKYETGSHVGIHTLFALDCKLRKRYGLQQRANVHSLRNACIRVKIRHKLTPHHFALYDVEHFYDEFVKMYENQGLKCSRTTKASVEKSHLTASPEILADANWLPRKEAIKAANINGIRLGVWVQYYTIIPYIDPTTKRLLYPVDKLKETACWRPMNFIRKHLTDERCEEIKKAADKRLIMNDGFGFWLYRVPELSHL